MSCEKGKCCGGKSAGQSGKQCCNKSGNESGKQCCNKSGEQCCGGKSADAMKQEVQQFYGQEFTGDPGCCSSSAPPAHIRKLLLNVPEEVLSMFHGCGSPLPVGLEGCKVLDLGCGSGRDCYICAALVGPKGLVTGIDMTPEQLEIATKNMATYQKELGYEPQMQFKLGHIEDVAAAGVANDSQDVVISNCVVCLSPNKPQVLAGAYAALKKGGEMFFSDIYADRRLPAIARKELLLVGGGALYYNDFIRLCKSVGFCHPRIVSQAVEKDFVCNDDAHAAEWKRVIGEKGNLASITFRLFKPSTDGMTEDPENYGQTATYKGGIVGAEEEMVFDCTTTFPKDKAVAVDHILAAILEHSRYKDFFTVTPKGQHIGPFSTSCKMSHPIS
eukprot:Platyproteum_vivax@DN7329_c0_g1_i1.p1